MSVSMLHIKKTLPKPTKSRMSEKYKDGLRQSWAARADNEENQGVSSLPMNQDQLVDLTLLEEKKNEKYEDYCKWKKGSTDQSKQKLSYSHFEN